MADNKFRLNAGEKREIQIKLLKGADFTADEIRAATDSNFIVHLFGDGILMGGMTYRVDPEMKEPVPSGRPDRNCTDVAQKLVDCLGCPGTRIKKVKIKEGSDFLPSGVLLNRLDPVPR